MNRNSRGSQYPGITFILSFLVKTLTGRRVNSHSRREVPSLERLQALRIVEEECEQPDEQPMSQDDEKCPMSVSEDCESSALTGQIRAELDSDSYTKPMSDDEPKLLPDYITL